MNNTVDNSFMFFRGVSESELEVWKGELSGECWRGRYKKQRLGGGDSNSELLEFEEHLLVMSMGISESWEDLF